jgi:flagellar basal body-associated protein FliL
MNNKIHDDAFSKIIEKVNERHMNIEQKKFERNLNNRSMNLLLLIIVILLVLAIMFVFIMIGFQPANENVILNNSKEIFSLRAGIKPMLFFHSI